MLLVSNALIIILLVRLFFVTRDDRRTNKNLDAVTAQLVQTKELNDKNAALVDSMHLSIVLLNSELARKDLDVEETVKLFTKEIDRYEAAAQHPLF